MQLIHILPRCEGRTIHGKRCRMTVHRAGMRFCRYHSPDLRAAAIADNTRRLRAYWQRRRVAEALAATAPPAA
jgi:hypothetical protein